MAFQESFDAYIQTLPEDTRVATREFGMKFPSIAETWLSSAEATRLSQEATQRKQEADSQFKKNTEWWDRNSEKHSTVLKENEDLKRKVEGQVGKQVATALEITPGTEVNAEQLTAKIIADLGGRIPSKDELASMVATEVAKAGNQLMSTFLTETYPKSLKFQSDLLQVQLSHPQEFGGEKLDNAAFAKYLSDNALTDAQRGYDQYVSDRRIKAKIEQGIAAGVKDRLSQSGVPGSGVEAPRALGVIEQRQRDQAAEAVKTGAMGDVKLGSGVAAMAAAQELRAEGK